jgi:hypothetical protein
MEEIGIEEARSFPGLEPPNGAKEVARIKKSYGTYIYYRDKQGNCWYDSVEGMEFKRKIAEAERKQKAERRNKKMRVPC